MGFYEDDRVKRKNRKYNFPTPEVNFAARKLIEEIGDVNKQSLMTELYSRLRANDDNNVREVITTAIAIVDDN